MKPTHSMTGAGQHRAHDAGGGEGAASGDADGAVAGSILGGKYRLISEIGRGGMGSVWRAEHVAWEAPVALKLMNRDIIDRPEAVARFEREVRLAAGLRSPHVVQVLDHGLDEATRTPYIAMELMEGESLARRLKRLGMLSPAETFHVCSHLTRALTRAHAAGIVHRDLKPDNVFIVRNEEESLCKVLDFGVAKWTAPDILESGLTRPGSVVGTPYYMSPEQIQGSPDIDHRADLWALAAIACECLTGRRPFEARDFAQLAVMLLGNQGRPLPSSLGLVPAGFDAWFLRATDPDITRRFQTAREMSQTLAVVCDIAPSSLGQDAHAATLAISSTRHDAPSVAPVSNTATRFTLHAGLWQRPMAKLVASTVIVTLLLTAGAALWFVRRPYRASVTPPVTAAAALPLAVPKLTPGPGIRPIRGDEQSLPSPHTEATDRPISRGASDSQGVSPHADGAKARPLNDDFDPEAKEKAALAASLARPKVKPNKVKRPKAPVDADSLDATATSNASAPARPRAAKPEPVDDASSVVDGRRIRTSL